MQILCEGHPNVGRITCEFHPKIAEIEVYPEPVLCGDTPEDMYGTSIYGSVIKDGSVYRMWYQAWPDDWDLNDTCQVGCVESDDGIVWKKPKYGMVDYHGNNNNHLTDLPFHCPSVFIDPHGSPDSRYRAFGFVNVDTIKDAYKHHGARQSGYHTAHSADGIHWELDSAIPVWPFGDVITSIWDSYADCARIFLKRYVHINGIGRRSVFEASWKDGIASSEKAILIPDEYDDFNAHIRGYQSADYYGMGVMPTKGPSVGFLWNFRHISPLSGGYGSIGTVDLSLVFQGDRGAKWNHVYGRPNFLAAAEAPEWAKGALYTASSPIDIGNETRLYFTGTRDRHGWTGYERGYLEYLDTFKSKGGFAQIGIIKWKKDRLFGYSTLLRDRIELHPRIEAFPGSLVLNTSTQTNGGVRVCVMDSKGLPVDGYTFEDCDALTGDNPEKIVTWKGKSSIPALPGQYAYFDVEIEKGTIYGFDFINS